MSTLRDVWRLDMWRRTEDAALWRRHCAGRDGVEIGCGDGRVLRLLGDTVRGRAWVGVDTDPGFCEDFTRTAESIGLAEAVAVCADASKVSTWDGARGVAAGIAETRDDSRIGAVVDVAVCAFSTLYLLPHRAHGYVLARAAEAVRPGGRVVVEVFEPSFLDTGDRTHVAAVAAPEGSLAPWGRTTRYRVDASRQVTVATRRYGPAGGPDAYVVEETIHWRHPEELLAVALGVGLRAGLTRELAPPGYVVLVVDV